MARAFNHRAPRPRVTLELLNGETFVPAMFRESPKQAQGIELLCNAAQRWIPVIERKAEFDLIVTRGGTFHEAASC